MGGKGGDNIRERVHELFLAVLDLPSAERESFLDRACAGTPGLREAVNTLLAADLKGNTGIVHSIESEAQAVVGAEAMAGSRIGPYLVTREIGRGGMGTVYEAIRDDDQYRKKAAIKVVRRGMDSQDLLERFRHERQILANLDHPNVAHLLDGGTTGDGRPFLVMEYIEGQPLDAYCRVHRLNVRERCRLFLEICDAVSYAHRNLVVHRDLKPGNILVTPDGLPKLLDFGVAKLLHAENGPAHTVTAVALRSFTPEYASPEQVLGDPITTAADVYSLGAVLYELLSEKRAHQLANHSMREIERVVCHTDPVKPSEAARELRREIEGDLDAIVCMALRKEPAQRYSSVEQFAADVRAYLRGLPVSARQGNFAYRMRKHLARNRTPIAAGVLIAAALFGGAAAATIQAQHAAREQARAEKERMRALESQARAEKSQSEAEAQAREARLQRENAEAQRKRAEMQRAAAERERTLADRRFEQLRQLSGKFLFDFHDSIAGLPGSTAARKMVVETGLRYYDSLAPEARGNRGLLEEIARGYDRLGDVQGNPYAANLGDLTGAMRSYRKALAVREEISDPSPDFLRDRILGDVKMAQVFIGMGSQKEADRMLTHAIDLGRQGPAAGAYSVRFGLANAYGIYGDLKVRMGKLNEGMAAYSELLNLWTGLAREGRDPFVESAGVSLAHTKLGETSVTMERGKDALDHLRTALEIDKRLAETSQNSIPRLRKVYVDYLILSRLFQSSAGDSLAAAGEPRAVAEAAADYADRMVAADPNNAGALLDVVLAQSTLGDLLRNQHDVEASLGPYRKSLAAAEKQVATGPSTLVRDEALLQAHHRLGRALSESGRQDEALAQFQKADDFLAKAEKSNPGTHFSEWRADLERGKGDVFVRLKHWKEAVTAFRAALAIFEELQNTYPNDTRYLSAQPDVYMRLANCYAAMNEPDGSRRALQSAVDRLQRIASVRPLSGEEDQERRDGLAKLTALK